jgi:hypothetical protein
MAFQGQVTIRSKIAIESAIQEEVNTIAYLVCNSSYEEKNDMTSTLSKVLQISGVLNNV